jgi:acetyltransferase
MSIRNLDRLFKPRSVALFGASEREGSLGRILLQNVLEHFHGPVYPVNPSHSELLGHPAYPDVDHLPQAPDLAVIATPPRVVPELVQDLSAKGTRGICVITAGFSASTSPQGEALKQAMLDAARPNLVRIVGPNCVGLQMPGIGVNASFASVYPPAGPIAFVAQSGAVITAVLDWAYPRGIGFSHVVSLGDMADVDFGDMLDYLAADTDTEAILLYIEAVTQTRKFMSAARAAARVKPVIVVKGGRHDAGARAASSHTGALAGMDAVYDAAFRRAGMLRVVTLEELFDVVETLATAEVPRGDDLTILTNGGGLGVLAADALVGEGGRLTELSPDTIDQLNQVLPGTWSHGNPIDIIGDANGERYAAALGVLLARPEVQSLLILNCPTALASSDEVASAVMAVLPPSPQKTVLTSWTGEHSTTAPRQRLQARRIPTYDTPEDAIHAFMQMVNYQRNQQMLLEVPPSLPETFDADLSAARKVVDTVLVAERSWLTEPEAKQVLAAYGIPVVKTEVAGSVDEVDTVAGRFDANLAVKILSADITHKSDVGGVALNVAPGEARAVAQTMLTRVQAARPDARIDGFTLQTMVRHADAHELIVGMINDAQFGPVLLFGHGGTAVEVYDDKALALPPLNMQLAQDMISRTQIYRLLRGYRDVAAADLDAIALTLVRLSQLIVDLPAIEELDINPLLANADGVIALDARIKVAKVKGGGEQRLAIRPYPKELEADVTLRDGATRLIRPVLPEDEPRLRAAFEALPQLLTLRLTQIDYDRQMALIMTDPGVPGTKEIFGMARLLEDPDRTRAELAVGVAADQQRNGVGTLLIEHMLAYARTRGIGELVWVPAGSDPGLTALYTAYGFAPVPGSSHLVLPLA